MNRYKMTPTPDTSELKTLMERFLDATATEEETSRLTCYAKEAAAGTVSLPADLSPELAAGLRMLASLDAAAEADATDISIPSGLEERLDRHITSLASASRRKRTIWRRITAGTAAAAAAAILLTVGVNFQNTNGDMQTQESGRLSALPHPTCTTQEAQEEVEGEERSVAPKPAEEPRKPLIASASTKETERMKRTQEAAKGGAAIPTVGLEPTEEEAREALKMPLSTISASINEVFESVENVAVAISGTPDTFDNSGGNLFASTAVPVQDI